MELYLFDRTTKIIHFDDLSILDSRHRIINQAQAVMSENEVFVFQLAVICDKDDIINEIKACYGPDITCINTDVVDKYGNRKKQIVPIKKNVIQPLFFTVKAEKLGARKETSLITISTEKENYSFNMTFDINTSPVKNNGYDDLWRLSRINWLNSDLYIDENVVKPYTSPRYFAGQAVYTGKRTSTSGKRLAKTDVFKIQRGDRN